MLGAVPPGPMVFPQLDIDPVSGQLFVFFGGAPPGIMKSSDSYDSLGSATSFSTVDVSGLVTQYHYTAFAIAPDGRILVGGVKHQEPNHS